MKLVWKLIPKHTWQQLTPAEEDATGYASPIAVSDIDFRGRLLKITERQTRLEALRAKDDDDLTAVERAIIVPGLARAASDYHIVAAMAKQLLALPAEVELHPGPVAAASH